MNIDKHQCSKCGRPSCCATVHQVYQRYQQELAALLAQPEPDRARIAFVMFLISALDRRFHVIEDSAS